MAGIIIGAILIVIGALLSILLSKKIKNKNIEIQFMKTTSVGELKKNLSENEAQGLEGYREYAELKGTASSTTPMKTPYSEREAAYYAAEIYQVFEEQETYKDETGTHSRMVRKENLMSSQKAPGPIVLKDATTGDEAYIELTGHGIQLDTIKMFDKFEPQNMMNQYGFFNSFTFNPMGARTLGFRMVENGIPSGQPIYVLGEAYIENGRLNIAKPTNSKKPFIVSVRSEGDLIHSNKVGAGFALYGGIVLAILGVLSIIFIH